MPSRRAKKETSAVRMAAGAPVRASRLRGMQSMFSNGMVADLMSVKSICNSHRPTRSHRKLVKGKRTQETMMIGAEMKR